MAMFAVLMISMLSGCAKPQGDPDVKKVKMAKNPTIVSDNGMGSATPIRFGDIPDICYDVVIIEPVGVVLDGVDFDYYNSLVKARVVKSYVGSYSEGDEIMFLVSGTSKSVWYNLPITIWQKSDARYVIGLREMIVEDGFNKGKDMLSSLSLDTTYFFILPYEVTTVGGTQYVSHMVSSYNDPLMGEYEDIITPEILFRAGDATVTDENTRKAVVIARKKTADQYQVVIDDTMVVTLETFENALKSFKPEDWKATRIYNTP